MAAPPVAVVSNRQQFSHLHDLPTPTLLNRSSSSSRSSLGLDEPRMATLHSLPLPFPRQTSAEFLSTSTPSPNSTAPSSPFEMLAAPPTWPNPASYSFSHATRRSPSTTPNKRSHPAGSLIRFELALGDRLAARLDGETTLQSIKEASGVVSSELRTEEEGPKKLVSTGSASAVQKARQLLDAKLSQTPIRTVVGVKLDSASSSSLTFIPSIGPHITRFQPLCNSTYRLVTSPLPPTGRPLVPHVRPRLGSFPSSASIISEFSLPPSRTHSQSTSPGGGSTPTSEPTGDGFFASPERRRPRTSSSAVNNAPTVPDPRVEGETTPPPIGNFDALRDEYVQALVDELEVSVKRRSLVRVKLDIGSQEWRRDVGSADTEFCKERWSLDEIENWQTDVSESSSDRNPDAFAATPCPVSPTFSTSLSSRTAKRFATRLLEEDDATSPSPFKKKTEISQVHIWHLDKSRASFGCAIAECRGQELRNLPKGNTASGTLMLRKCSTLPSKPFALAIVSPTLASRRQTDGTDLRLKILADKAATSPSLDLSAAMQSATWEVDDVGEFRVKVDLKEERFGKGETEIRWNSRERWENEDGTLRFTLAENRYSDSSRHDFSVELCSPTLNHLLATYALDQAQGKKAKWQRDTVTASVENLVAFGERFVADQNRYPSPSTSIQSSSSSS